MASRRSREYQNFFNKLKITAKDLDSSRAIELLKEKDFLDLDTYHWMTSFISISNERRERYKDYENMVLVPELHLGLVTYADDGTQMNNDNLVIDITSDNDDIVKTIKTTLFENLDMNADLWRIFYSTCQYGDSFYEIVVNDSKKEIMELKYLPPMNIERVEIDGNLLHFIVNKELIKREAFQQVTVFAAAEQAQKIKLEPWEIVHFKIDDNLFRPYGRSVMESGRRTWKQLSLMEDAMLVYRLERAPEKRVFYIDVGTLSTPEAEKFIERIKAKFRKKKYIDPATGKVNEKATPLSILEDFWIPVRSGQQGSAGTRIDILQGGRQLNEIDDTKYFRDKLMKTMHIPPQYMQEGGGMDNRNSLSQMDIKFSRTIERIQRHIVKGLEKVAIVALTLKGYTGDDLRNFQLNLTPPSNIAELVKIEAMSQKINLISSILGVEKFLPRQWIYKNIMQFSDKEITDIQTQLQLQVAQDAGAGGAEAGLGGGAGGAIGVTAGMGGAAAPEAGGLGVPGAEAGAPGAEAGIAAGAEAGAAVPPEAGGAAAVPAAPAPGPEVASKNIEIDHKQFIIENRQGIAELIKYVKRNNHNSLISKDNNVNKVISEKRVVPPKKARTYRNQFIHGEFKGLKITKKK